MNSLLQKLPDDLYICIYKYIFAECLFSIKHMNKVDVLFLNNNKNGIIIGYPDINDNWRTWPRKIITPNPKPNTSAGTSSRMLTGYFNQKDSTNKLSTPK